MAGAAARTLSNAEIEGEIRAFAASDPGFWRPICSAPAGGARPSNPTSTSASSSGRKSPCARSCCSKTPSNGGSACRSIWWTPGRPAPSSPSTSSAASGSSAPTPDRCDVRALRDAPRRRPRAIREGRRRAAPRFLTLPLPPKPSSPRTADGGGREESFLRRSLEGCSTSAATCWPARSCWTRPRSPTMAPRASSRKAPPSCG